MKDRTSNILAKRLAEIAANKAIIRNHQTQIDALNKDIGEKEQTIYKLCGQIGDINLADLSAEQLASVVDALYDDQDYHSVRSELIGLISVAPGTDKTYLFAYQLKNLIWLSSNFDLDAAVVDAYLMRLLRDDSEIPDWGPVAGAVNRTINELMSVYEKKGKPLSAFISDKSNESHLCGDIVD